MGRHAEGWKLAPPRKPGTVYYVRFTHEGREFKLPTGERDSGRATQAAAKIYADVVRGWRPGRRQTAPAVRAQTLLDEAAAEWLVEVEPTLDRATFRHLERTHVRRWMDFFRTCDELTTARAREYKSLRLRSVLGYTLNKELGPLRAFSRWAHAHGFLDHVPVIDDEKKTAGTRDLSRRDRRQRPDLAPGEVDAILDHLPEWSSDDAERFAVKSRLIVAYETSLRPSTLAKLRAPDDYRRGAAELRIRDEADKARYGRSVPLSSRARAALDSVCPEVGAIFGKHDLRDFLRPAAHAAGIDPARVKLVTPYVLRHLRITHWVEGSDNVAGVMRLAGHKHLITTSTYIHASTRAAEEVLAAVAAGSTSADRFPENSRNRGGDSNAERKAGTARVSVGAGGGSRTRKPFQAQGFKPRVSAVPPLRRRGAL
jgi:integrase